MQLAISGTSAATYKLMEPHWKKKWSRIFSVLKVELEALLAPFHFVAGFFSRPLDEREVQVEVDQDQRLHPVDNETST